MNEFQLFISYERRDSGGWSLLFYQHLVERFGEGVVFRDNQKLRSGERWRSSLRRNVSECRGFVLVIGPDWREKRVLEKLHDPEGWVRKEIETALAHGKEIFPVLVGGAVAPPLDQLPETIRPAISESNHFQFHDGPAWQHDLDRLCEDIAARTGLVRPSRSVLSPIKLYDRVLARLDRNPQTIDLKSAFQQGGQRFLVNGIKKGGFRHFAIRCALDVLAAGGAMGAGDEQRIVALNWGRFSDPEVADERHSALLRDIAENLLTESGATDPQRLTERISRAIRQTRRPTVIYCTATVGSRIDLDRAEQWFAIWREILRAGPTHLVIVILFVERSWWPMSVRTLVQSASCDSAIQPTLGTIYRKDLAQWVESDLRNSAEGSVCNRIKRQSEKMFRFHWTRRFDDIGDAVIEAWSTR